MPALSSTSTTRAGAGSSNKEENTELERFRAEWLAEVRNRTAAATSTSTNAAAVSTSNINVKTVEQPLSAGSSHSRTSSLNQSKAVSVPSSSTDKGVLPSHPAVHDGVLVQPTQFQVSASLSKALEVYKQAIDHEQKGDLDNALRLYRQAFRMDDNVDRAYRREEMLKAILREQQNVLKHSPVTTDVDELATNFKESVVIKPPTKPGPSIVTGTLANIVQEFLSTPLIFEPEIENEPVLLNRLPEELFVVILSKLDPTSIERFAKVSKKARVLTLDPGIWRRLVQKTYQPPQIVDLEAIESVVKRFLWDYRRIFIEQPRLRLDGVYIATCHYVRPGLSENTWVNTSHLITYHRYLRFYPNGQVLSLLANEEHAPQQIIPILRPTLRMNGLFIGQWKLEGTAVNITNLMDASGRFVLSTSPDLSSPEPILSTSSQAGGSSGSEHSRYVFLMTLELRSRPLGRWNRMDIQAYESLNLGTGDVNPIMLKHERPFWFSKVRSYA